jgi:hypothetical protein
VLEDAGERKARPAGLKPAACRLTARDANAFLSPGALLQTRRARLAARAHGDAPTSRSPFLYRTGR